jgi:hypothetical protein
MIFPLIFPFPMILPMIFPLLRGSTSKAQGYDQQLLPSQMPLDSAFGPRCAKGTPEGALLEAPDAWHGPEIRSPMIST